MYYSELVKKACNIMFEAHKEDKDKGGYPYVFHPFFLATKMEDEDSACAALLHDVIEDHGDMWTLEALQEEGFSDATIEALKYLTHPEGMPYMDYVRRLAVNSIAVKVKLADLGHNMDTRRRDGFQSPKLELYREAKAFLESL